jgi:hypothetical protein
MTSFTPTLNFPDPRYPLHNVLTSVAERPCLSAVAMFYAPSDQSGTGGMIRQQIRATPIWRQGPARYNCLFLQTDDDAQGMQGMHAVQALLFFFLYLRT